MVSYLTRRPWRRASGRLKNRLLFAWFRSSLLSMPGLRLWGFGCQSTGSACRRFAQLRRRRTGRGAGLPTWPPVARSRTWANCRSPRGVQPESVAAHPGGHAEHAGALRHAGYFPGYGWHQRVTSESTRPWPWAGPIVWAAGWAGLGLTLLTRAASPSSSRSCSYINTTYAGPRRTLRGGSPLRDWLRNWRDNPGLVGGMLSLAIALCVALPWYVLMISVHGGRP